MMKKPPNRYTTPSSNLRSRCGVTVTVRPKCCSVLFTRRRIESLEMAMEKRVGDAMARAQTKLDKLPVARRQSAEATIVRNELDSVMRKENEGVKKLWATVDKSVSVDPTNSKAYYQDEILAKLSKAELRDIPEVLKSSFIAKTKKPIAKTQAGFRGTLKSLTLKKNLAYLQRYIMGQKPKALLH